MKKTSLLIFIFSTLFLTSDIFGQVSKAKTTAKSFSITKKKKRLIPPSLDYENLFFKETNGNGRLDAGETATITFDIMNKGRGPANGLLLEVKEKNNIKGIKKIFTRNIPTLSPNQRRSISIDFETDLQLATGDAVVEVNIIEENGFNLSLQDIQFSCLEFIPPNIQIVAHEFSLPEAEVLRVQEQFTLTILIQNVGQGDATEVNLGLSLPNAVFPTGPDNFYFDKLKAGEKQEIKAQLITTSYFNDSQIPIRAKVSEKHDKYGSEDIFTTYINTKLDKEKPALTIASESFEEKQIKVALLGSHVDQKIPIKEKNPKRLALIIGNEDYNTYQQGLNMQQNVDFAENDARIFKEYAIKTLGVEKKNVFDHFNLTSSLMHKKINEFIRLAELELQSSKDFELIIYYAGHGYPEDLTKVPYLIPVDVSGTDDLSARAINLQSLYKKLGDLNAKKVTVFLDACFTGGGRESGLVASRGITIKPKEGTLKGNLVVFSASSGEQSALPFEEQEHGIFTYHLFDELQKSGGNIDYGTLADKLRVEVNKTAIRNKSIDQTPHVNTSKKVENTWRQWTF